VSPSALLFATAPAADGGPAAALPAGDAPLAGRLAAQLAAVGVGRVTIVTRAGWADALRAAAPHAEVVASPDAAADLRAAAAALAAAGDGKLLAGAADVLVHQRLLAVLLDDPKVHTGILAASDLGRDPRAHATRSERGRVVSAASPLHEVSRPTELFLDLLVVGPRDQEAAAAAAEEMAGAVAGREADDPASLLLVALARRGVPVGNTFVRRFFHARPRSGEEVASALEELATLDEDRLALDSAVKETDGFFTTFFVSSYSRFLARFAARRGWTPNQMTTVSMLIGIGAAAAFATGSRAGMVAGALLLQAAFTVDCVDGQLARYTLNFSKAGAWLDSVFDRGKEYLVYAGLAIGASRGFDQDVWTLAAAALALQTVRHMIDFSFAASEHQVLASAPRLPLEQPDDVPRTPDQPMPAAASAVTAPATRPRRRPAAALGIVASLDRWPATRWARRAFLLPIGERFALISLTAALFTPRATFIALLAWGGVVAVYAVIGRILRSVAR
jgi:phosphatidylglycerophosphate synthase